ncbi:MAG: FxsA family protein [Pseudolabrys sp.]|nr:FxsA family protein [Pseudolabrys sp.]
MIVAKWLLLSVLALPLAEAVAFIAVAAALGFFQALGLLILGTVAGVMVLRHAGGNHIARVRTAMAQGGLTALQADGTGGLILLAGILLVIPGFITDALGLLVLTVPLWRMLTGPPAPPARTDGIVDLEPEQWRRVDDPALSDRRPKDPQR